MPSGNRPSYDVQKRNKAHTAASLRGVVTLYLIYLGWKIVSGSLGADTSMPLWVGVLLGGLFVAAAVVFGVYTIKRYRADRKAAIIPAEPEADESASSSLLKGEEGAGETAL